MGTLTHTFTVKAYRSCGATSYKIETVEHKEGIEKKWDHGSYSDLVQGVRDLKKWFKL